MVVTGQDHTTTAAHWVAVGMAVKLREQRPNLTSGRAGDILVRDPHN